MLISERGGNIAPCRALNTGLSRLAFAALLQIPYFWYVCWDSPHSLYFYYLAVWFLRCCIFPVTPHPEAPNGKGKGGRREVRGVGGGICPKLFANPCQRSRKKPVLIPSRCTAVEGWLAVTGGQCTAVTRGGDAPCRRAGPGCGWLLRELLLRGEEK